jgi:hypothetical protein
MRPKLVRMMSSVWEDLKVERRRLPVPMMFVAFGMFILDLIQTKRNTNL